MKNELIAYCIMESFSEPNKPTKIQTIKNDLDLWTVRFYTHLQDFDVMNRNRRIYSSDAMLPALHTSELQELMAKKRWMGEFDHPTLMGMSEKEAMARIMKISQQDASHFILSLDVTKRGVSGWIETRPLGRGKEFGADIICGSEPSFSLRALAKVVRQNGQQIINTQPRVVTYDAVVLPSHKIAYRDNQKPIQLVRGADTSIVREAIEINATSKTNTRDHGDRSFQLMTEAMNDFIAMESTNISMISEQNEVTLENMTVTKDMKHVILKGENEQYLVKLEDEISHIVTESMSKFFE